MSEKLRPFCPNSCGAIVKRQEHLCHLTECWHLEDRAVTPRKITLNVLGKKEEVTIVGENNVFSKTWILSNGHRIAKNNPWEKKP